MINQDFSSLLDATTGLTTFRPTTSRLLNMDTRFAHSFNSNTREYSFQLPERINRVKSIQVVNVELPKSFTNFSLAQNSISFDVSTNSSFSAQNTDTITINEMQYNTTLQIITAINNKIDDSALDSPARNIAFALTDDNLRCTITSLSESFTYIRFLTAHTSFTPILQQCLGWKLGFRTPKYALAASDIWISDAFIDKLGPRYALLVIDAMNTASTPGIQFQSLQSTKQVFARIPLTNTEYMDTISATKIHGGLTSEKIETAGADCTGGTVLQRLRVQLCDEFGNALNTNQVDFSFLLKIETQ